MKVLAALAASAPGFYWNGVHMWPIAGYPSYYISRQGQVYSARLARLLKDCDCAGYRQVSLSANGHKKSIKVHRLVVLAFLANPLNKPDVNHKDGNKANNCLSNLEWCTEKENMQHAVRMGLFRRSKSTGRRAVRVQAGPQRRQPAAASAAPPS